MTVYLLGLREFKRIAELQVFAVALKALLPVIFFLDLMGKEFARKVFDGHGVERFAVKGQVIVLSSEIQLEIAPDIVGPFVNPMAFALESERARRAVEGERLLCGEQ